MPAFIADLEKIAGVKIIYDASKVYDKEASFNSFTLEFATPIAPAQANTIFSAWHSKGLVEYAENNGRVFPT
ncbi:MAG: hypothetical protein QJT81_21960 [Candidatus Thiothrix putei]|uniref:Uncharacterized protein n=1 Tax=Candidatus Thiothrix putei TaxID=3080811 RepID=A0AA95HG31_9GAMM|nr:MAG: hypothetical protein QJT81_21960 [Candidatus Thiothrix putei]